MQSNFDLRTKVNFHCFILLVWNFWPNRIPEHITLHCFQDQVNFIFAKQNSFQDFVYSSLFIHHLKGRNRSWLLLFPLHLRCKSLSFSSSFRVGKTFLACVSGHRWPFCPIQESLRCKSRWIFKRCRWQRQIKQVGNSSKVYQT